MASDDVAVSTTVDLTETPSQPDLDGGDVFFTDTIWYSVVLFTVNCLGIFFNGSVVYIVARYRDMRNTVTLCFANLAITDIMLTLSQALSPIKVITGFDISAYVGCGTTFYLHHVTIFATGMTMTFLAFDRHRIITRPLKSINTRTKKKIMLSFVAIWTLSLCVFAYIPFVHVDVGHYCKNVYQNVDQETGNRLFNTSTTMMHYVIPIVISGYYYGRIYVTVRGNMAARDVMSSTTVGKGERSLRSRRLRGIRSAASVLCLYAVCYFPTTFLSAWRTWDPSFPQEKFYVYHLATSFSSKINVLASPFIYALSAASFKKKIRQTFFGQCCRRLESSKDTCDSSTIDVSKNSSSTFMSIDK